MADEKMESFRRRLGEVMDIGAASGLLQWDQETYMPPKGAEARGQQIATLSALAHRLFTDKGLGEELRALGAREDLEPDEAKLVEVVQHDYDRETKLPEEFVEAFALEQSRAFTTWVKAREQSDFGMFEPRLEAIVELVRRKAELLGYEESPYDALLDEFERGMTAGRLKVIFGELAERQSALLARIMDSPNQPDTSWLETTWDTGAQEAFAVGVLSDMGYDWEAGRQDKSVHPFTIGFGLNDVRITTRLSETEPFSGLMGSVHEGGHALYGQGHHPVDERTPLLDGASLGVHESQSRMWENIIGRSLPFWKHYAGKLRALFPEQLKSVSAEQIHQAINRVRPSLIRTEADECTYNLHVIIRFEIEVGLVEGALAVADVPGAWNAKMKEYLGIEPPDDARGCLQDIHWAHGAIGYFPTYALGNLYAAQLFEAIERERPEVWREVEAGQFGGLLAWLRERVHRHGRRKLPVEIIRDATGEEPGAEAFMRYLERKFGALYGL